MIPEKKILLLGSGYVAPPCLNLLLLRPENKITIASRTLKNAQALSQNRCIAISLDVSNNEELESQIQAHDLVISLIPYTQHVRVIKAAIKYKKHVVTTSYISPEMQALDKECVEAGITCMNEIGVDPGFYSYCGGLPAPEASNNPLGYKFSWSSRGVLLALRNNAKYLLNGKVVEIPGHQLMDSAKPIRIYPAFAFLGYPNRDSTPYTHRYAIPEAQTVIRGTLRYDGFPQFIKALVAIGFLNDEPIQWLQSGDVSIPWRIVLSRMLSINSTEEVSLIRAITELAKLNLEDSQEIIRGMKWFAFNSHFERLGLFSDECVIPRGNYLDTLCATLELKMQYQPGERDMVMLQHKFVIEKRDGSEEIRTSTGLWFGEVNGPTAMAKTVGVPCAIAAQLILDGEIHKRGVIAPMTWDIVEPLIVALEKQGIRMVEEIL